MRDIEVWVEQNAVAQSPIVQTVAASVRQLRTLLRLCHAQSEGLLSGGGGEGLGGGYQSVRAYRRRHTKSSLMLDQLRKTVHERFSREKTKYVLVKISD